MPLLFSLGIHDALEEIQQQLEPGEFPLRIPGRRIRLVLTRTNSCVVQFAQHNVARTSRCPVAHGQDTHVELCRRAPCRHGGSWTRCCETPKVSRSWEPLWGILSFCQLSSSSVWPKSVNCGTPSLQCRTCNVHGSSSSNAQVRVATTCCGPCPPVSHSGTRKDMTRGCSVPWKCCWVRFPVTMPRSRWHGTSRLCL